MIPARASGHTCSGTAAGNPGRVFLVPPPGTLARRSRRLRTPRASAEHAANRTKPGRVAGLRCLRDLPLPEAHGEKALTLGRLLRPRLRLIRRGWGAGEQVVADRRDELRRDPD